MSQGTLQVTCSELESPLGPLLVAERGGRLHAILFPTPTGDAATPEKSWETSAPGAPRIAPILKELKLYFEGKLESFQVELDADGTEFQQLVWKALMDIPFGHTITYGELAHRLGKPTASRAVGGANGRNPIPVVVPCHRVIGANGKLTGYGGGLPIKEWLLRHEGILL